MMNVKNYLKFIGCTAASFERLFVFLKLMFTDKRYYVLSFCVNEIANTKCILH